MPQDRQPPIDRPSAPARYRPKVGDVTKRQLVAEAGGKCANPGCPTRLTHFHHIREWATYKSHDAEHMIAICPSCHDAVHHGRLRITSEALYRWKGIERPADGGEQGGQIYVEPDADLRVLAGSLSVVAKSTSCVFIQHRFGGQVAFRVVDADCLFLNLQIFSADGGRLLRVVDNVVRTTPASRTLDFRHVPGHFRLVVERGSAHVASWVVEHLLTHEPTFVADGIPLVDVEVVRPGWVRVQGIWPCSTDATVAVTTSCIYFLRKNGGTSQIRGAGPETRFLLGPDVPLIPNMITAAGFPA